jgi:peptidoglycan hydrolase-like protein with peptidoglycan-binding domain
MSTPYPIARVVRPRDLSGTSNGRLRASLLSTVTPVHSRGWSMHHIAARCWEAMRAAAWRDGVLLSMSGNPYRSYERQVSLFRDRYASTSPTSIDKSGRLWNGVRYYRTRGAPVAVPGTSNHGWGLAIDLAIDADGDPEFEWPVKSLHGPALTWLRANAARFGFSWEMQIEPWHLRMVTGDNVPAAVLEFEKGGAVAPPEEHPLVAVARAIAEAKKQVLRVGSRGDAVKWLQIGLNNSIKAGLKVDGQFGRLTDAALRRFQEQQNLKVDGICGPVTWSRLFP